MWYVFFFVVISMEIGVGWTIYVYTGMAGKPFNVYPAWLWEVFFSFYWFSFVFKSLNKKYFDVTQPRTFVWELKPLAGWVLIIHFFSAYFLTFAILPLMGISLLPRVLIAYLGSYLLTVSVPMQLALVLYPRFQKKLESERITAERIRSIALQSPSVQRFVERYPNYLTYVYDNVLKNQTATCLFLYRQPRAERDRLYEDIVLEIPIDMKSKTPVERRVKNTHYIFLNGAESSAVLHFPGDDSRGDQATGGSHTPYPSLDEDTLRRFDSLMERFPLLDKIPFPLAVRGVPYELV